MGTEAVLQELRTVNYELIQLTVQLRLEHARYGFECGRVRYVALITVTFDELWKRFISRVLTPVNKDLNM